MYHDKNPQRKVSKESQKVQREEKDQKVLKLWESTQNLYTEK